MTTECNGKDNESWPLAKQTNVYTQSTETPTQNSLHLANWISNSMSTINVCCTKYEEDNFMMWRQHNANNGM